ncbi:protocatechuate 3,4-dioxygenase subunit alpha [Acrocarpospora corrugata]|uniref:Protocatechuate 3,4-dioxygenase subunit alpha n=1 Tax=Acrocarpospora corrugata TaxID=35763 RepID=A0A5M3W7K6_9ACTN|nr:protocatechuate 3,4-dioxygenase subunit alpha [Acrocarpospora corrugata]GES03942.1 protocatechuate 3,4-dioxygenase subunit alpha [Acrocarpospora corrugata]
MKPTPSQTVGPFYGYALPYPGGGELAPAGHPDAVVVHGFVYDGAGEPVPDALLEFWQADPGGGLDGEPGSMRKDQVNRSFAGRDLVRFTGFARVATDADGQWAVRTFRPGATGPGRVPYISVCVFARGLLHHLYTRIYFEDSASDPLLASLEPDRRATLVATAGPGGTHRLDIHLQGERETVFLEFR